jgi:hypothetical protein
MQTSSDAARDTKPGAWPVAFLFALIFPPLLGAFTLFEPWGRDQGIHATIAYALQDGLITYRDVFNMKPPLTTGVHWLALELFGHSVRAIRLLDLVFVALAALGLAMIGRRLGRGPVFGAAAAVGLALPYYSYGFWEHAQTDGWAGLLVIGAVLLMIAGWDRAAGWRRRYLMAAAGAVLGLAFALKYTIGGAGILIFVPFGAQLLGDRRWRFLISDLLFCVLGGLGLLAALGLMMAAAGALSPFLEIQNFLRGYMGYRRGLSELLWPALRMKGMPSVQVPVMVALGAALALFNAARRRDAVLAVLGLLWIAAGWLSGAVQGKGLLYHFLPMLPGYALLFALALEQLCAIPRLAPRSAWRTPIVVLVLAALILPSRPVWMNLAIPQFLRAPDPELALLARSSPPPDFDFAETLAAGRFLRAKLEPGEHVFLWGYETALYFLAGDPPHYRYPYSWTFAVNFYDGRYTDDLLTRLRADPPAFFVVQDHDATPPVTGREESSAELLPLYPRVEAFLYENYNLIRESQVFRIYARKPS